MEVIFVLGLMIAIATVFALLARRLKQPLILGYVLAGLVLGPAITGIIDDPAPIMAFFAEFGLILLLFVIGLELDFSKIKSLGRISIVIGTIQVALIAGIVGTLSLLFGFDPLAAAYVGLIVALSSTIVVIKLLSDKGELNTAHGNMILGILIVEDILAVVGLTLLGAFAPASDAHHLIPTFAELIGSIVALPHTAWFSMTALAINGALFVAVAFLFSRFMLPRLFTSAANSPELLFIASFGVALTLAMIGAFFSFSLAIGAFVAGIALSSARFSHDVMEKVEPIKDFILVLFFVALGTLLTFTNFVEQLKLIAFLLVTAMLLKPIIMFFLRKIFRYSNRVSFLISIGLAQISEFSLILAMAGVAQGVLPAQFMTGAVIATLLSMMVTAYLIRYDEQLYRAVKPFISPIDRVFGLRADERLHAAQRHKPQVILLGVSGATADIVESLEGRRVLLIEKNPKKARPFIERGVPTICTDAYNNDLYQDLIDFSALQTAVSAVPDVNTNIYFTRKVKELRATANVVTIATSEENGRRLYEAGATLVLIPEMVRRMVLTRLIPHPALLKREGRKYEAELQRRFSYRDGLL